METVSIQAPAATTKREKVVVETKTSRVINVSAAKLWEIIGPGFADAHVWSSSLDHSEGKGSPEFEGAVCSERYCEINAKGFNKISETLTEYDEQNRTLAYAVNTGLPGFVTFAQNRWRVIEVGLGQSRFEMNITMRMKPLMGTLMGGMFRKNLNQTIDSVIEDLTFYAENGRISAAKQARLNYLAKKK